MHNISKVAVIGAGTMGAGIAGQVANAGIDVYLLDLPGDGDDVNAIARRGLERLKNPDQPGLMSAAAEQHLQLGNIRDDLHRVTECDWVAEAVVEQLDVKHRLYAQLAQYLHPGAILTSNTSTIPISLLTRGMEPDLQRRFAITHFFNPVRFMRLLELVRGEQTSDEVMQRLESFCEARLGKGVVPCADTPGFLANRVGVYAIQCALHEAFRAGFSPPRADALFGRPMGIPKTGVFGLYDLIGIDLMADVVDSLVTILPGQDAFHAVASRIEVMQRMIGNDQCGNKSGRGFYLSEPDTGARKVLDFGSGTYLDFERPEIAVAEKAEAMGVRVLLEDDSDDGRYAWRVLSQVLCYAASLIPEVGDDPSRIDEAMRLGYNWIRGPFELLDEIGLDWFVRRLRDEGREVPPLLQRANDSEDPRFYRAGEGVLERRVWSSEAGRLDWRQIIHAPGVLRFNEIRQALQPVNRCAVASWYVYRDTALVEFHSKANVLDADSMALLQDALDHVEPSGLQGLIVHNDAQHFSCGVNLEAVRAFCRRDDYDGLDRFLQDFQRTVRRMASAGFPVVAAPVGLSIGGGFEVVLHAQRVICHANSVMGLVESLVGLVPGGGGCKETLYRWVEKMAAQGGSVESAAWQAFMNLGYGRTASSPPLAREMAMLRNGDDFLMNRDRLLAAAVDAVETGSGVEKIERPPLAMAGSEPWQAMLDWLHQAKGKGQLMPHDTVVGAEIAGIVTGGDIAAGTEWSEQALFDAERRAFLRLAQTPATQARIDSMLDSGRSLRN